MKPPLEMWGAPLEHQETSVAVEHKELRACGWGKQRVCRSVALGWGENAGDECMLTKVQQYGDVAEQQW